MARQSATAADEADDGLEDEWDDGEAWDEDEEYEDDPDEDWAPSAWDEDGDGVVTALEVTRTVSFGFLSMLPLLFAYEWAFRRVSEPMVDGPRSVAEALVSVPFLPLGSDLVHPVRRGALAVAALLALIVTLRRAWALGPRLVRVPLEGALAALVLGPVLAVAAQLAEPYVGAMVVGSADGVPPLTRAALVMGGAAYEELVFRVLALSLLFILSRQFFRFFGLRGRFASILGATTASFGSAAFFALFHLEVATAWLGPGGEPFDAAIFTWRAVAGLLLAALVVWRGVGVAAWAHALFNLALLLGIQPPTLT